MSPPKPFQKPRSLEENADLPAPRASRVLLFVLLLPWLLTGCLQTEDELVVAPDGSGTIRLVVDTAIPADIIAEMSNQLDKGTPFFPPLTTRAAARIFPEPAFVMKVKEEPSAGGRRIVIEASFKDLPALLGSPYARAHALTLERSGEPSPGNTLQFRAVSGLEAAARMTAFKDTEGAFGTEVATLLALQKKAPEMRHVFRVTLPRTVDDANGIRAGQTVAWTSVRTNTAGADPAAFAEALSTPLEARCSAEGFPTFRSPARMGLARFAELPAGAVFGAGVAPDAARVLAAARFVPHSVQVTRTLDLTGDGGSHENVATLTGALHLPKALAPLKWGELKVDEVIDARGNNLKRSEPSGRMVPGHTEWAERADDDGNVPAATGAPAEVEKAVTLDFLPPEWAVQSVTRIRATLKAQYGGGELRLIKLTNAIPANWIRDASKSVEAVFDGSDVQRTLAHPALKELELSLKYYVGMAQSGGTMLMIQTEGKTATLEDVQVHDATGRPWPTYFQPQNGEEGTCQISVAGHPPAPLSLALLVNASGAGVSIPIALDNIALTPSAPAAPAMSPTP